ncbi:MAG: hypothetical protein ACI91F_001370 [Candidatus Binatia bacterium]|jgi:hypothetical protein
MLSVLSEYCRYLNFSRPHQGIEQRVPEGRAARSDEQIQVDVNVIGR